MRSRSLLRGHWRATVMLGILAGIAAAVPMTAWSAARRTDAAWPAYLAGADIPDVSAHTCPVGLEPPDPTTATEEATAEFYELCMMNRSTDLLQPLREMPGVEGAEAVGFIVGEVVLDGGAATTAGFFVGVEPPSRSPTGGGTVIEGRALDQRAANEFIVDEWTWKMLPDGVEIGSDLTFRPLLAEQAQCASGNVECEPAGRPTEITLVGVERMPADMAPRAQDSEQLYMSAGFWDDHADQDLFTYGIGYNVWLADDVDIDEFRASFAEAFPDRAVFADSAIPTELDSVPRTISYQARAMAVFAALTAIVAVVYVGQAIARQTRREGADAVVFVTLGATRREAAAAAVIRMIPVASIAVVVAVVGTIAASPIGPVGLARRTIGRPTVGVDLVVLAVGASAIVAFSALCAAVPAWRSGQVTARLRARDRSVRIGTLGLAPAVLTGVRAVVPRGHIGRLPVVVAVSSSAFAVASVVAAAIVVDTFDEFVAEPANYGAPWDIAVGNNGSTTDEAMSFALLEGLDGVEAASGLLTTETLIDGHPTPLLGLVPVPGFEPIDLVIDDGRPPIGPGEIVLGPVTMNDIGAEIGDRVSLEFIEVPGVPAEATVVGTARLNDAFSMEAGQGAAVDGTWARADQPGAFAQTIAVRFVPDRYEQGMVDIRQRFGAFSVTPEPAPGLRNMQRIEDLPAMLALVVVVLAAGSLAHAMWVAVRQRRGEFSVLKTIGFRRRQIWGSVGVQAMLVAVASFAIGLPIGVVGGRWGWRAIIQQFGLDIPPANVPLVAAAALVGLLLVAMLASAIPASRAVRTRPAEVFRAE